MKELFSSEERKYIKIFCPRSPEMPITRFQGVRMNAWFNVYDAYNSDNQGICNAARVSYNGKTSI